MDFRKLRKRSQDSQGNQPAETKKPKDTLNTDTTDVEEQQKDVSTEAKHQTSEFSERELPEVISGNDLAEEDGNEVDHPEDPDFDDYEEFEEEEDDDEYDGEWSLADALMDSVEENTADHFKEILRFRLAAEYFSLYLEEIEEIIKPRGFTEVPRVDDWILGIVSLRGTMVPVIDLARRLDITSETAVSQRIIIISHEAELCGLLVDEVRNVELVDPDSLEAIPSAIQDNAGKFLHGLLRVNGELIAQIDIAAVLGHAKQLDGNIN